MVAVTYAHLQAAVNMHMIVVLACKFIVQHVHVYTLIMYSGTSNNGHSQ